ncbi:hypothetical protein EUAN_12200 [Andreesenia angusta]|uniref:Uncharacterized protein n=1 Tax=Andreesenia angusta TaxID=39480 RepID=A0A1S1V668_9FIRM|nr:hypothetical protein [Andreesenia angusta]OHW62151.1 hypothetical protein EUAN_12200 [Andreesenia angusta]
MNRKEGTHYNKNEKVKRDQLIFMTEKISNFKIGRDDVNFDSEYQKIKRINTLLKKSCLTFEMSSDINKLYTAIYIVYHNKNIQSILKKKVNRKELSLLEKREYYKLIEVCFGDKVLANDKEYDTLKSVFKAIDIIYEIVESVGRDIDLFLIMIEIMLKKGENIEPIIKDIYNYKCIQNIGLEEIRTKMMYEKPYNMILDKKNIDSKHVVECKYYEAKEVLESVLGEKGKSYVRIDCMGKDYSEIKKFIEESYEDEYSLVNLKL